MAVLPVSGTSVPSIWGNAPQRYRILTIGSALTVALVIITYCAYRFIQHLRDPQGTRHLFKEIAVDKTTPKYQKYLGRYKKLLIDLGYPEDTPVNSKTLFVALKALEIRWHTPWLANTWAIDYKKHLIHVALPEQVDLITLGEWGAYFAYPNENTLPTVNRLIDHLPTVGFQFIGHRPVIPAPTLGTFLLALDSINEDIEHNESNKPENQYKLLAALNCHGTSNTVLINRQSFDIRTPPPLDDDVDDNNYWMSLWLFQYYYLGESFNSKDGELFYDLRMEFKRKHPELDTTAIDEDYRFNPPTEA
ncbi:hypothetical protein K0U07_04740 [bacterium]|nr:hypothetical protein [bacterium]